MADITVDNLGKIGVVKDDKAYKQEPEAWTEAYNVRIVDDSIERLPGHLRVFGTLGAAPAFLLPVLTPSQSWWLYADLVSIWAYNTTHDDVTNAGGAYNAANIEDWNGGVIGGIPFMNNGVDVPQFWAAYSGSQLMQDMTNWPSTLRAKVVRALGNFLVAINCTKSGTAFPHMVKWSHPADPGQLPSSWDETDPNTLAGENQLSDVESGELHDMLPLRGQMILYKENSTWRMYYIGGQFVFKFEPILETSGILAPRCVSLVGKGAAHFVVTQDDIIVHNGSSPLSILTGKMKRHLFANIDPSNYKTSFVFENPKYNEIWFCYPSVGSEVPDRSLIWNYGQGTSPGAITEADCNFVYAASGTLEVSGGDTWASVTGTWAQIGGNWNEFIRRNPMLCDYANEKIYAMDKGGALRDGVGFEAQLQRTGLALTGRKSNGTPIVDFQKYKQINRVWIRASGGPFQVRLGIQELVDGPVAWTAYGSFDPATDLWVDFEATGRAVAVEFYSAAEDSVNWRIDGYTLDLILRGRF